MIHYFVTGGTNDRADTLTKMAVDHRMISFFYMKDKRSGFLRDYVVRGSGRYIDEEGEAIRKMTHREFFTHFLSRYNLIQKREA